MKITLNWLKQSPVGAEESACPLSAGFLSPLRGFARFVPITHGSRRGLLSVAAPRLLAAGLIALLSFAGLPAAQAATLKTQNVFLIISDGFRWQEVFNGAEANLMTHTNVGVTDTNALRAQVWRETPEARRAALLPFFLNRIASQGQIFGNQSKGSVVSGT